MRIDPNIDTDIVGERARNSQVSNTALRLEIITFVAKLAVSLHTINHVHYVIKT